MESANIRISKYQESRFKKHCSSLTIYYGLVKYDGEDAVYRITYDSAMDVFTLGNILGIWGTTDKTANESK